MSKLPIIYKYTKTGATQQWEIHTEGNKYWTIEGQVDGKLTTSLPTVCIGKNIGRSNETTPAEQALLEAKAKWQKKIDKGYNEVLSKGSKFFEPMLADDYKKSKLIDFKKYSIWIQPKLDGLRCISENGALMSRNGKPYLACPHLYQSDVLLDGELYNHTFKDDFNKIVSLCKKTKPTKEDLTESASLVQHWVYDFPGHPGVFSDRYEALKKWITKNNNKQIMIVPTFQVKSIEDIKKRHDEFLELGFEGSIIRIDIGDYENKRSKQLLKYKDFVDEEFEILDAIEGEGGRTGTIGKFVMKLEKDSDKTFKSNVKGDFDYLKDIWKNRKSYIGKMATVKYFQRTPDNIPRFPYIIKINREEYE